jgi:hypothetical protein
VDEPDLQHDRHADARDHAYPSGTLTGSGKAPACAPGISWTLTGKFTAKTFDATASITLPGNTATTVVSLTKK